ncbi:hypothetical protein ACI3KS_10110, partial [Microbacterium sp. ZW T5_45]|uniref:hypothetical protein n=1 Tax=Microbacterium sp. ZW T5_45 TaxID=3378080 RepID=UPI003851CDD5
SAPSDRRRRRIPLLIGAAVAVVAIAVGTGVVVANVLATSAPTTADNPAGTVPSESGATAAVEAYLDALVAGDATTALGLLPVAANGASEVLLNPEVYAQAVHPAGYTITSENARADSTTVSASIDIDGSSLTVDFVAAPNADASAWSLVEGPVAAIRVGDVRLVPSINSVPVDLSAVSPGSALPALLGRYEFAAPVGNQLLTFGDAQTATASADSSSGEAAVDFTGTLSSAGRTAAIDAVRSRVESCMLSDQFRPRDCPNVLEMEDPGTYAVTDLTRSWRETPQYDVVETAQGGYAVVVTGGTMRIDYGWRYAEGDPWTPDDLVLTDVFGSSSGSGTTVPFTIDATSSLSFDYSAL